MVTVESGGAKRCVSPKYSAMGSTFAAAAACWYAAKLIVFCTFEESNES